MNRLKWFAIGFLSIVFLILASVWFKRETVESILINRLIQKVSPSLPFQIESYELSKNLTSLQFKIKLQGAEARLDGPLHWSWIKKEGILLRYEPTVQIDGASPFSLLITAQTEREWVHLEKLEFQIAPNDFKWKKFGVDSKNLSWNGVYDDQTLKTEMNLESLAWVDLSHSDHAINLSKFHWNATASHLEDALNLQTDFSAKELEMLWGSDYLDLSLTPYPLHLSIADGKNVDLTIGKNIAAAHAMLDGWPKDFQNADFKFQIKPIPLPDFIPWAGKNLVSIVPDLANLSDYQVKKGIFSAQGSGKFNREKKRFHLESLNAKGDTIDVAIPSKKIAVQGMDFTASYISSKKVQEAAVSVKTFNFEHFSAKLSKTFLHWNEKEFSVEALPLAVKDIPVSFGKISATLEPAFDLETSVALKSVNFTPIANGLCLPVQRIPPMTVSGNFTNLQISKSIIDPTGKIEATLFDGKIEINDFGIFDLDTEVPETDFDLDWSGIDLQKFGNWANFGEIQGTLEGQAHDIVMQGSLPTQYHFLIEVDPTSKLSRVDFSPEAMKNVVKIFTGADLDQQIPGIAGWMMFGWPSHVLGGYDVYYAGLKLTSENGHIVVETLDKPGIVETERKHFVLYGPRFKMPLQSSTYPLILDATSMSNFVHQLITQLHAIRTEKEANQHEEEPENTCEPPQI